MNYDAVLPYRTYVQARDHLLQHTRLSKRQEDLCFCLWRPSTGRVRYSAIVSNIIEPVEGERTLHGNAAFDSEYLSRSLRLAFDRKMGLGFMHNHLTVGWQGMSDEDIVAERDRIAPAAAVTGLPLVGLTMGTDGSLSARFWIERKQRRPIWCHKVRVVDGGTMRVTYNDSMYPEYRRRPQLQRTIDSWGLAMQQRMARLRIGIVGLGSVGAVVAEALARMGVANLTLIDADKVETHNLDRLLNATSKDVGTYKAKLAARQAKLATTANDFRVTSITGNLQNEFSYQAALDCDLLFSCVDRPLPKDLLNHIAYAHCIPVIFGGVFIDNKADGRLAQANWTVSIVGPGTRCLRCDSQYSSSDVVQELDGSLDNPEYLRMHDSDSATIRNQNVFPFSANLGSSMVIEMVRYMIAEDWWPAKGAKTTYYFVRGNQERFDSLTCKTHCSIRDRIGTGDTSHYPFIESSSFDSLARRFFRLFASVLGKFLDSFK
ncbi:MAG: ThiF family adenylyltransferase [Acidobacteria bacterium]|nr:ThiF family adenylyltransferase [Acidobacteriota bacterium]